MRFGGLLAAATGGVAIRSTDDMTAYHEQVLAAEGSAKRFWRRCPGGLRKNGSDCLYDVPSLWEPTEDEAFDLGWNTSTESIPLVFRRQGGHFYIEDAFLAEFAMSSADEHVGMNVFTGLARLELVKNISVKGRLETFVEESENLIHDLDPVSFFLEEWGVHTLLHLIAGWGHKIAHNAAHSDHAWGSKTLETLSDGVSEGIHFYLDKVFPVLVGPIIVNRLFKIRNHWMHKVHHGKGFIMRIIMRSQCVANEMKLEKSDVDSIVNKFENIVTDSCGADNALMLAKQMQRTNLAMIRLFEMYAKIGRCMWPAGWKAGKYASKIGCATTLYKPLLVTDGHPGIVFEGLTTAAIYTEQSDSLLTEKIYGHFIHDKFDVHPDEDEAELDVNKVFAVKANGKAEEGQKCLQVLAMHRAFERTFSRLIEATEVYLETFARARWTPTAVSRWQPCKDVFYSVKDAAKNKHWCKAETFTFGNSAQGKDMKTYAEESDPCTSGLEKPAWEAAEYTEGQDGEWCKTVGQFNGHEYKYFGPHGSCGDSYCCKRLIIKSIWVETSKEDDAGSQSLENIAEGVDDEL